MEKRWVIILEDISFSNTIVETNRDSERTYCEWRKKFVSARGTCKNVERKKTVPKNKPEEGGILPVEVSTSSVGKQFINILLNRLCLPWGSTK